MIVRVIQQKTNIIMKIIDDFETDIKAIGVDYDSEEVIFILRG